MVMHTYNPSTWEGKTGGSRVGGQPETHREILSQKKKLEKKKPLLVIPATQKIGG
jgi:hypothetical protein